MKPFLCLAYTCARQASLSMIATSYEADCLSTQSFQPPPGAGAQEGELENEARPALLAPNSEGTFST